MSKPSLITPEHDALALQARAAFVKMEPGAAMNDPTLVCKVAGLGYYPYLVPSQFGGKLPKVDVRSICVIREELAYRNAAADSVFAVQGLGSHPVLLAGSEAQKRALLPLVASGQALCAFALTEPEAGSDVAALSTTRLAPRRCACRRKTFARPTRRSRPSDPRSSSEPDPKR